MKTKERMKERNTHETFLDGKKLKNPNAFGGKTQKENTWKNVIKFLITDYLFILRRRNQIQTNYIHLILLFFSSSSSIFPFNYECLISFFSFGERTIYVTFLFQIVPFENDWKEISKGVFLEWNERKPRTKFQLVLYEKVKGKSKEMRQKKRESHVLFLIG